MGMENYYTSGPNMSAGYGYGTSHHGTSNMTEGGMVGSQYPLGLTLAWHGYEYEPHASH